MVADAVAFEPVSTLKFPADREKTREFFNIRPDRGSGGPDTRNDFADLLERNSLLIGTGNFCKGTGNLNARTGN